MLVKQELPKIKKNCIPTCIPHLIPSIQVDLKNRCHFALLLIQKISQFILSAITASPVDVVK